MEGPQKQQIRKGLMALGGPKANWSKAKTGKIASSTAQAPGHDPECGPVRKCSLKGAPHLAPSKRPEARKGSRDPAPRAQGVAEMRSQRLNTGETSLL